MVYRQVNIFGVEETNQDTIEKPKRKRPMTRPEAIKQLTELIEDRRSFDTGAEDTEVFRRDIEALRIAIAAINFLEGGANPWLTR